MGGSRRRRWTDAAWRALALLVLPVLLWILLPARIAPPPRPARVTRGDQARADRAASAGTRPASTSGAGQGRTPAGAAAASSGPGLDGEVQDPDGKPAAGATVTCAQGDRELSAQTDEAGKFRFDAEAAGCSATARKPGFAPSGAEPLRAGADNRLRLAPPTGIAGNVVDETGAPVMICSIAVESFTPAGGAADGGARPAQKISLDVKDQDGAFAWSDLAPGRYDLAVAAPYHPFARARGIEVRPGAVTTGVRLALSLGATVTGKVVDAKTNEPLGGAMVFAEMGVELGLKVMPVFSERGDYKLQGAPTDAPFDLHVLRPGYDEHVTRGLRAAPDGAPLRVDVALLPPRLTPAP